MEQWRASRHLTPHAPTNPFRDAPDAASILTAAAVVPTTPGDGASSHRPRTPPETPATPYELFDVEPPIGLGRMPWDSAGSREATTPGDSSSPSTEAGDDHSPPSSAGDSVEPRDGRRGRSGARRRPPPSPAPTLLFDEPTRAARSDDRYTPGRDTQLSSPGVHSWTRPHPDGRVRVSVRIRPPTPTELQSPNGGTDDDGLTHAARTRTSYRPVVEPAPEQSRVLVRGRIPVSGGGSSRDSCATDNTAVTHKEMRFDAVFAPTASQRRVYEEAALPIVDGVLRGYNGTVLAYGQTGTGKTYTMSGPELFRNDSSNNSIDASLDGSDRLGNPVGVENPFVPTATSAPQTRRAFGGCAGEDRGVVAR